MCCDARAGFGETAYPAGAILTRDQVRELEEKSRVELIHQIETASQAARLSANIGSTDQAAQNQLIQQQQEHILARLAASRPQDDWSFGLLPTSMNGRELPQTLKYAGVTCFAFPRGRASCWSAGRFITRPQLRLYLENRRDGICSMPVVRRAWQIAKKSSSFAQMDLLWAGAAANGTALTFSQLDLNPAMWSSCRKRSLAHRCSGGTFLPPLNSHRRLPSPLPLRGFRCNPYLQRISHASRRTRDNPICSL